ncbi:MAG: hypothetical protein H0V56_08930 [Chthoniobacterales bacterium]|nr:hypothetical protein [Chthoniobacterales bacterium]
MSANSQSAAIYDPPRRLCLTSRRGKLMSLVSRFAQLARAGRAALDFFRSVSMLPLHVNGTARIA